MKEEEVSQYILQELRFGKTIRIIKDELQKNGVESGVINRNLASLGILSVIPQENVSKNLASDKAFSWWFFLQSASFFLIIILSGTVFYLWQERFDLRNTNSKEVRDFYSRLSQSQVAFTDAREMVFPDERKFADFKQSYISNKESFVEANLKTMTLSLYERGEPVGELKILTKGKEGSWWETPTGNYKVLGKGASLYSSIGNVWMPYAVQFYGNYFIHGWPHYDDGAPVSSTYSGGCIRLSNEDAHTLFNFVQKDMPILVLEDMDERSFGDLGTILADVNLPNVSAQSFVIGNISSGEIILEKKSEDPLPISSIANLMTAVVSHEVIYLGRSIAGKRGLSANAGEIFYPDGGERYVGLDLLYPLLTQSSDVAAKILSAFVGENIFTTNMNAKADSLGMASAFFDDTSGLSEKTVSSSADLLKLLQYIYFKRPFIFDITRGQVFEGVGVLKIGETINLNELKNTNEFVNDNGIVGAKSARGYGKQMFAGVWNLEKDGKYVPIAIVVLGSDHAEKDVKSLLEWVRDSFSVR